MDASDIDLQRQSMTNPRPAMPQSDGRPTCLRRETAERFGAPSDATDALAHIGYSGHATLEIDRKRIKENWNTPRGISDVPSVR